MNRPIYNHKHPTGEGLNEALRITACDEPGPGVANHTYHIEIDESQRDLRLQVFDTYIHFHCGPGGEDGYNGISNEALLAILIDRLEGFQRGQFRCRENAIALTKLEEAMMWLGQRTLDRVIRGVEGTDRQ